jgi:hypothetical protein
MTKVFGFASFISDGHEQALMVRRGKS